MRFETVLILSEYYFLKNYVNLFFFFFCFSPSYEKSDRKKHELEISTLFKIFVEKSDKIFHG